ncbi:MAG TPA: O-antigen ligase family protein [Gemmataceae bacterium]|nr:O-antigen ligase family protein [Gemmataceae bacterium]
MVPEHLRALDEPPVAGKVARWLRAGIEILVLAMVALAPWAFAAVHPLSLLLLSVGLSIALLLWAAVLLIDRRLGVGFCPVVACLIGIVILGLWQLAPLPDTTLTVLSPATAQLRADLIPADSEGLTGEDSVPRPSATLSLDPGTTRRQLIKLLAVVGLFTIVRYRIATPASFRRFAIVCVVNGALLSVFALTQNLSSSPDTLYWRFVSQGHTFGPFVCRNHFPFYINVCFGLGLGLLLPCPPFRRGRTVLELAAELGRCPVALWLVAALAVMLAASIYSLSRGGAVALAGAAVGCGLLAVCARRRIRGLAGPALAFGLALGLLAWLGADIVGQRLRTLGDGALEEGRQPLWERVAPLAKRFPLWGTGYGTFESVEPMQRVPGDDSTLSWEHAHNDYLESLIEGGIFQLALVGVAIALVYRAGVRAYRGSALGPDGSLVLGGLFGLTTLVIHAFGDFGMHMPAIVVLATVLAAHLTAAGGAPAPPGRWAALLAAATALVLALTLPADAWERERAERFRLAAEHAVVRLPDGERDVVIRYLEAAVACVPDDARLRLRLAEVRHSEYLAHTQVTGPTAAMDDAYLRPALRDYLRVRAGNPLYYRPHARIAGGRQHLHHADTAAGYLDRACRLAPADGGAWYLAGLAHLTEGDPGQAWHCWRCSLDCSSAYLPQIIPIVHAQLGPGGLTDRVLPRNPDMLVEAARFVPAPDRPVLLTRALDLSEGNPRRPEDLYRRARLLLEADRPADAVLAYDEAVARAPDRVEWRFELAQLLFQRGDLPAARDQVRIVLRDAPGHAGARALNAALVRVRSGPD